MQESIQESDMLPIMKDITSLLNQSEQSKINADFNLIIVGHDSLRHIFNVLLTIWLVKKIIF